MPMKPAIPTGIVATEAPELPEPPDDADAPPPTLPMPLILPGLVFTPPRSLVPTVYSGSPGPEHWAGPCASG